ncbi:MAG: SDR family NAD(P)-dependent oxidoreductase [Lachnospiraceae bacterium]|nr:SDR family NAD(P)-dependent oxidoreductase [Lachnospiraceae bacterium]
MKKVLITGGAGFIGGTLARALVKQGYRVRVIDNLSEQIHGKDAESPFQHIPEIEFMCGDVRNKEDWRKALKDIEVVVHLAAETGTGQSMYEIYRYTDVNIGGTANLMDILTNEQHCVQKVIVASSRAIYGEGSYVCKEHGIVYPGVREEDALANGDFYVKCPLCKNTVEIAPTREDAKINPLSVYGITKQVQEQLVLTLCKNLGISALAYRFQNVYGPGQSLSNPYTGILSIFSTRIRKGESINIFEDGKESRDFVYIDDVVEALIAGIELSQCVQESINIGTGVMTTVEDVVETLMECYGKKVPVTVSGMYRIGDIRSNYADLQKAREILGFEPKVSFQKGISEFAAWVLDQAAVEGEYEASLNELRERGLLK